jgi:hypothetical protein
MEAEILREPWEDLEVPQGEAWMVELQGSPREK